MSHEDKHLSFGPKLGIQLECPVIYPTLVHLTKNTPCNLHAGSRKSCTVYPWKSAWSSIPALELRSWYPWRRTPLASWTQGHEIMHSIPQEQCMILDPCVRASPLVLLTKNIPCKLNARSRNHALYTPRKVRDVPTLGIQLDSPLRYRTPLTKNTPSKLKARSRNHALYTPGRVHDLRSVP